MYNHSKRRQRQVLAAMTVTLGLALTLGESIRSYGQGRPFVAWFDDFVVSFFLFFSAWKALRHPRNIKFLSAVFAGCATGMTMSYLGKILRPDGDINSNLSFALLTNLLLAAILFSLVGMIWTLSVDFHSEIVVTEN